MGTSQSAKIESHERIVRVAARQLRERGFADVSVPLVMEAAGLTHGGFYKHFGSKADLLDEATARALDDGARRLDLDRAADVDPLTVLLERYLAPMHRDHPGAGCAVASLAGSVGGAAPRTRARYTERVEVYVRRIEEMVARRRPRPDDHDPLEETVGLETSDDRDEALLVISALVGAVLLSRAVDDAELSDDLLRATLAQLSARPGR